MSGHNIYMDSTAWPSGMPASRVMFVCLHVWDYGDEKQSSDIPLTREATQMDSVDRRKRLGRTTAGA